MKTSILLFLFFLILTKAFAQAPVINNVNPGTTVPLQNIVLTGSGFNSDMTKLNVWFDHVKGTIVNSSSFSIEVKVPAQARFSNVEVINLGTNLSGKSPTKFMPSFGGTTFDQTKVSSIFSNADPTELFDIASSDFDLDGKPDLVVTKTNNGVPATDIIIYKNQSSGIGSISFSKTVLDVGAPTANVSCGDLNGDGKPDIVATRNGATRNEVFMLRNINSVAGTLSFAPVQKVLLDVGQFAFRVAIRDLNRDGKPELIVSNALDDGNPSTDNQIYIFQNQSTPSSISFAPPIKLPVVGANTTYGLEVQDLDGDGLADIVLNQFQTSDLFIFKNLSAGNITFGAAQKLAASGSFNNVTSTDLNKDGLLDLIVTATLDNKVQIFVNNSSNGTIAFQAPQVLTSALGPWGVDASDIDGDGDVDIVVANRNEAKVNVFRQDATLSFTKFDIVTTKPTRNLRVGDYDGDGKPDIALTSFSGLTFSADVLRNANCVSPVITSPSATICAGQTVRLQAAPALGVTFDWKKGGVSVQSGLLEYFDATIADNYTVTATGIFDTGCSITSLPFSLTATAGAPPVDPDIIFNNPCLGGTLNLSTSLAGATSYIWTGPNGVIPSSQSPAISSLTTRDAGIYSLQILAAGCSSNITKKLIDVASVPILPVTASPSATVCAGSTVTLSTSGTGFTYQWLNGGVPIAGKTASNLSITQEGDYSLVVAISSPVCNQETAKTNVKFFTAPVANFSVSTPTCKGVPVTFTDQSTADSRGALVYTWDFGNTLISTLKSPSTTYTTVGSFNPQLTISYTGLSGCSSSVTKPITISTPLIPTISASLNPICLGETSALSISGSFSAITWVGVTGSTSTVNVTQSGSYSVNTIDTNGCTSSASLAVTSKPLLTPFVASTDKPILKAGEQAQLSATSGADSYAWSPPGGLNNPSISNPIATPTTTTTYTVLAKKTAFCDAQSKVLISVDTVTDTSNEPLNAPLLFSPNGDTINDKWIIPNAKVDCTMTIYDGRGSQIYQKKGYNSEPWDGTYNGSVVPVGVYYYVFSCSSSTPITGSVLVVK